MDIFKERNKKVIIPWNKQVEIRHQCQCPACKNWLDGYNGNVRHHITIKAKEESFKKALGIIKETPHFKYFKQNIIITRGNLKITWK